LPCKRGTSIALQSFSSGDTEAKMPNFEHEEASTKLEAYELPPSDTYLACFGLFIFSGLVATLYVIVGGA
jgi:hypothetical protein